MFLLLMSEVKNPTLLPVIFPYGENAVEEEVLTSWI